MLSERLGVPAALFSLKCYVAAILALYIAYRIGLERPYWAFLTSYIVAQPLAGAVVSKALFRLIGTFVGAMVAVAIVPPLVNAPELLALTFALWLGLCVFVSLLERTPRSYMFVLAGYSTCIIGLPSVNQPDTIFTVASLRVQEISIGIICGSLVHAVVWPGSITGLLLTRIDRSLRDAEHCSYHAMAAEFVPELHEERHRLAQDITELHQLSIHLPFDTTRQAPRIRTVRAMQDQISQLLPLGAAVQDRLSAYRSEGWQMPPEIDELISDAQAWLANIPQDCNARQESANALIERCVATEPPATKDTDWSGMLRISLLARIAKLISVHRDCTDLRDQMTMHSRQAITPRVAELLEGRRNRELHRDYAGAARAALSAMITLLVGCALWIGSGWNDAVYAVTYAGVFLALFSGADNPIASLKGFMLGTFIATVVGGIYSFAIIPQIDGLPMLAVCLAPAMLIGGALMASPRYAGIALPAMMGLASPSLLSSHYNSDFANFANVSIAQLVGVWFAIIMIGLLQSAGASGAIRRTVRAGWNDIATRANLTSKPDLQAWINRMLDRISLLAPRLAAIGQDSGQPLYNAMRDLRTGAALGELRQLRMELPADEGQPLTDVLIGVGDYYRQLDPDAPSPAGEPLLNAIDSAIDRLTTNGSATIRRSAMLGLVSLRRNLFPDADSYPRQPA